MNSGPHYCKSCGAYIPDREKKCLACGFPVEVPSLGGNPNCVETASFNNKRLELDELKRKYERYQSGNNITALHIGKNNEQRGMWVLRNGGIKYLPKESNVELDPIELSRIEQPNFGRLDDWAKKIVEYHDIFSNEGNIIPRDYYRPVADAYAECRREISQNKEQEKPDIDLDDLMGKTFFTVKTGGEVSKYYLADRPKIERFPMNDFEYGRTIGGRIIRGATDCVKHVINLQLIEK